MQLLILPVLFFLMYMLLLRPQQQRVRRQQQLISTIGVGDRVVTAGGLIGRVVALDDETVWLEVADEVTIELMRMYVIRRLDETSSEPDDADDPASADELEPQREGADEEDGGVSDHDDADGKSPGHTQPPIGDGSAKAPDPTAALGPEPDAH